MQLDYRAYYETPAVITLTGEVGSFSLEGSDATLTVQTPEEAGGGGWWLQQLRPPKVTPVRGVETWVPVPKRYTMSGQTASFRTTATSAALLWARKQSALVGLFQQTAGVAAFRIGYHLRAITSTGEERAQLTARLLMRYRLSGETGLWVTATGQVSSEVDRSDLLRIVADDDDFLLQWVA